MRSTTYLWSDETWREPEPLFLASIGKAYITTAFIPISVEEKIMYLDQTYSIVRQFYSVNADINDETSTYSIRSTNGDQYAGRVVVIGGSPENNWYHWTTNWMPRLVLTATLHPELIADRDVRFLFHPHMRADNYVSLIDLFGIGPSRRIFANPHPGLYIENAIIPTMIDQNCYSPELIALCRDYFQAIRIDFRRSMPARFYVSRENLPRPRRQVANYEEFLACLESSGIEPVVLDDLSGTDQVELFRKADLVVGGHGAGLSNLIYCQKRCCVLIMDNQRNINANMTGMFSGIAKLLGLRTEIIQVEEVVVEGVDYENFYNIHARDFTVNIARFRHALARLDRIDRWPLPRWVIYILGLYGKHRP